MNVISWSGGHDSTVMLHYLLYKQNIDDFKVMFVDSTITLPDTLEYIQRIVRLFGLQNQFVIVTPEMTFFERLLKYHFWPSITKLWCNQYVKRRPIRQYYKTLKVDEIHDFIAVSIHDSPARAERYSQGSYDYRIERRISVVYEYPLIHWTNDKKIAYSRENKIPENPTYKTVGFSGCYFCPFFHKPNYLRLKCFYPDLFEKLCHYERLLGKRASPDFWISSLASQRHLTEFLNLHDPRFPLERSNK